MLKELQGTGVALVTPLNEKLEIDFQRLEELIDHVINGGIDYIVTLGTTGESPVFSWEEKLSILHHTLSYCNNRVPVVLGMGGNNTSEIIGKLPEISNMELTAILSVSPFYNRPSQEGIISHYQAIAKQSPFPIILYNVPGRTASNIEASTSLELASTSNIVGIKDSTSDFAQLSQIASEKPDDFLLISGEDSLAFPLMSLGGDGLISVLANCLPQEVTLMVQHALMSKFEASRKIHFQLQRAFQLIATEGNPVSIKAGLAALNICDRYVRLPLAQASNQLLQDFQKELEAIKKG